MIRALVLDYGGVLSTDQGRDERRLMADTLGVDLDSLDGAYWKHRAAYDRSDLTAAYWEAVSDSLSVEWRAGNLSALVHADGAGWGHLNPTMVEWAANMADRLPLALLSNMPHEVKHALLPAIGEIAPWTALVFSCDVGVTKPDAGIYAECARRLGVEPREAIMVDDRPENAAGATGAGMIGVVFRDAATLGDEIDQLLATTASPCEAPESVRSRCRTP